jgi:hypothetical protein
MCGEHGHHRSGFGFRGYGRRGFPSREQWLERLQAYREQLDQNLKNVDELIQRLSSPGEQTGTV